AADRRESRAQALVARDDLAEAPLEGRLVEPPAQATRDRDVVRTGRRLELLQEPEPLLRERERRVAVVARPAQGGAGARGLEAAVVDPARELGDARMLEQRPHGELDPECPSARRDAGRPQRIATELEEVVVGADPVELQRLRPQPGELPLRPGARRP